MIVGAGLAGAATAWHLARLGVREVLVLEQEEVPGTHASGRNAAIVRRLTGDPGVSALARAGAGFIIAPPPEWGEPVAFQRCGLLLVGEAKDLLNLQEATGRRTCAALGVELRSREDTTGVMPWLRDARIEAGLWCPEDGVVDVAALLAGYLRGARAGGAELRTGCRVLGVETAAEGGLRLRTSAGPVHARTLVNAAGPWALEIARLAGAVPVPARPFRRHLFVTAPLPDVDPGWPVVWEVTEDLYFRPESGGMLLSACDEEVWAPEIPPVDPGAVEELHRKLSLLFPAIEDLPLRREWAGLRTFTPDRRFVIGPDPRVQGFFWVAGLGGHGVTTSGGVGELAARWIRGERPPRAWDLSPDRFA